MTVGRYAYNSLDVRKTNEESLVVCERRNGEFIFLSRPFTTREQAEKERDKLNATFTYKFSLGVGAMANK